MIGNIYNNDYVCKSYIYDTAKNYLGKCALEDGLLPIS